MVEPHTLGGKTAKRESICRQKRERESNPEHAVFFPSPHTIGGLLVTHKTGFPWPSHFIPSNQFLFCFMVFLLPPSQLCHPLSLSPLSTLLLVCWHKIQSIFLLKLLQLLSLLQLLQVAPRGCYSIAGAGSNWHLTADADIDDVDADADMADVDADD